MNNTIGTIITTTVIDENEQEYFVQKDGITYSLGKSEIKKPLKPGSSFRGFAYENEQHGLRITRNVPAIGFDRYGWGKVVSKKFGLGVFVDMGLPDKDLAISMDDLPALRELWPDVGDQLLVALKRDRKGRLWGELADDEIFKAISQPAGNPKLKNRTLTARVINPKKMGTQVLTTQHYVGFIDKSEEEQQPRLGEAVSARVIGIRPNKTLYLSLRPRAYEAINDDAEMIYRTLMMRADHFLPYNDHSDPADIQTYFGISKAQFKRAIGHLFKHHKLTITPAGIELVEDQHEG
ncbi:S1-like domain-containing RNA-binding protein [Fructilactobacillus hinvesii]|uniref:S1-like domain-containing RNA-binding protein n=1 Tax=Fructilactobacillus hinvesii TaxID=2940300 RepID=A0ABY5BQL8_9LACO|nr:S1-like domain-containing RNA-binding protein [Fructilactobacillus hinvesii]USS87400.1 S1-like domain-containing RNA-binding protein [Fructilactobacillus hinvesii]